MTCAALSAAITPFTITAPQQGRSQIFAFGKNFEMLRISAGCRPRLRRFAVNVRLKEYDEIPYLPIQVTLYKILASSANNTLYAEMEHILTEDVYYTAANNTLVQIMSKNATKWNGIKATLEALNVSQTEAVYFGDDNDDIEPIRMCGIGVAVSNAIEAVINAADYITGSNDEDGVAHFIEANLL